jgi:hypothetical protein
MVNFFVHVETMHKEQHGSNQGYKTRIKELQLF